MGSKIERRSKGKKPKGDKFLLMQLREDVRALNTAVTLISQKMKHLVRNEKILGRNLVILNKKFQGLSSEGGPSSETTSSESTISSDQLNELNEKIESLKLEVADLKANSVQKEDLSELKHIVDSINPLEYVTIDQAKEMLSQKPKKKK